MPKRPGLTKEKLVDAAIEIVNSDGVHSLSIPALAAKFKVKPPSLYNHIKGLDGLKQAMTLRGIQELTQAGQKAAAGRAANDALKAVAIAYRDFAKSQPGLYELMQTSSLEQSPEMAEAETEAIEVFVSILRGYDLEEDKALHAIRCIRSSLHGFVALEIQGGFGLPLSIDESFEYQLRILDCGLSTL